MPAPAIVVVPERDALLTNLRSERVKSVVALGRRAVRARTGRFVVEGPHAVRELCQYAASHALELYVTAQAWAAHPDIPAGAADAGAKIYECTEQVLSVMTESSHPQGVLAVASRIDVPIEAGIDAVGSGFAVILSNVRDPGNAGTVIRAADAFGASAVFVTEHSVDVYNAKVIRSTAGSVFHLPICLGAPLEAVASACRAAGITLLAADGAGSLLLPQVDLSDSHAWVVGNEAWGLPEHVQQQCDHRVAVPIVGHAESLNLAMAATVCLHTSATARLR